MSHLRVFAARINSLCAANFYGPVTRLTVYSVMLLCLCFAEVVIRATDNRNLQCLRKNWHGNIALLIRLTVYF